MAIGFSSDSDSELFGVPLQRPPSWTLDTIGPPSEAQYRYWVEYTINDAYLSIRQLKETADRAFDDSFLDRLGHARAMKVYEELVEMVASMKIELLSDLK